MLQLKNVLQRTEGQITCVHSGGSQVLWVPAAALVQREQHSRVMAVVSEQISCWPTLLYWLFCKASFFFNINMWKMLCCHTCIREAFLKTEKLNPICKLKIYFPFIFTLWDNWNMYWAELWKIRKSYFLPFKEAVGMNPWAVGSPAGLRALWDSAQCCPGRRNIQCSYCLQPPHSWWQLDSLELSGAWGRNDYSTSCKIACCDYLGACSSQGSSRPSFYSWVVGHWRMS